MTAVTSVRASGAMSVVEFDDGTSFRCTRDFARRSQLSRGQEIDDVFVARLQESASDDLALAEAQRLNQRRRYSRNEISHRLREAQIASAAVERALEELERRGELNDRDVALRLASKGLRQLLTRDSTLTEREFQIVQARRLMMRGFGAGAASDACRRAWQDACPDTSQEVR
ncbi:MAG: RecX family transcriptional regulator [Chloroflexi bacterium]|nr:RecX family transcriptional regulator [Chloroflexota bacterium]